MNMLLPIAFAKVVVIFCMLCLWCWCLSFNKSNLDHCTRLLICPHSESVVISVKYDVVSWMWEGGGFLIGHGLIGEVYC